jgi:flagellar assembly protein FliH
LPETTFRLTELSAPTSSHERDRATGYAAGWAAGARAAAKQAEDQRTALAAAHQAAEARRDAEVSATVAALARAAAAADARTAPVVDEVREALALATIQLAEAVVGHELSDAETSARSALWRALSASADLGVHTIRVSPRDHALLVADGRVAESVAVVADPSLSPGDAISEHPNGYLDAQVSTAFARARAAILGQDA